MTTVAAIRYADMLRDPRWQRRRLEILSRAGFACERCSAEDDTLHVHHRRYKAGAPPWDYADEDLIALCEDCHGTEHGHGPPAFDAIPETLRVDLGEAVRRGDAEQAQALTRQAVEAVKNSA